MRKSFRFVIYMTIGLLIYQVIESEDTSITHSQVKNVLIIGILITFILLMVTRAVKQRYEDRNKSK